MTVYVSKVSIGRGHPIIHYAPAHPNVIPQRSTGVLLARACCGITHLDRCVEFNSYTEVMERFPNARVCMSCEEVES